MTDTNQAFDPKALRQAFGQFATGVTIITTTSAEGDYVGLTANSFSSVSLEPPLVLWSLDNKARSLPVFEQRQHFAIHVLNAEQVELSNLFASKTEQKFAGLDIESGPDGIPLLKEYAARFVCRKTYAYEGGDHTIFVGEVLDFSRTETEPLLFHGGQYAKRHLLQNNPQISEESGSFNANFLMYLLERVTAQVTHPFHQAAKDLGLSVCGMHLLAVLSAHEQRSVSELIALNPLETADIEIEIKLLDNAGLVNKSHQQVTLSQQGRDIVVQLLAAGKAFEADALSTLDEYEQQVFKNLLRRVIQQTSLDMPEPF